MAAPTEEPAPDPRFPFLFGGGALARLIYDFDWSKTSLGRMETWPGSLRTTVGLILRSPVPIVTLWGEDGVMLYNDAYSGFAGGRHPQLLGSKVREGWPEVAEFNDHVMKVGLSGGTLAFRDQELTLFRHGGPEQVWMNLDYSPVLDERGNPAGVIAIVVETTGKVRAERWLEGERERLRQMFFQAPGFMAMLRSPEHVFELANPAYMQLVGHRDILGRPVREALPEVAGQGFVDLLDQVFSSGVAYSGTAVQIELQRRPGGEVEQRYVDFVYQPLRDEADKVVGIFAQGTDVTDRVLAEQAARKSEEQFRRLAQTLPNQVWTSLPSGLLDWFNDRVYEYSGAGPGELDGENWASIVHPDDLPGAIRSWTATLTGGAPYQTEFRLRGHDGLYRWHLSRAVPLQGPDGTIQRWIGTNTDIDDQKMAAQGLEHLNDMLEARVEERTRERDRSWRNSRDLQVTVDADGGFRAVNPAWTTILGHPNEEVVGRNIRDFIWPEDEAPTIAALAEAAASGNISDFINRYRHQDGTPRWISWYTSLEDGLVYAYGRDITAQKQQAAALAEAEDALRQSQKMEAVGQLTGGIAHDFNNLLQGITGSLDLVQKRISQGRINEIDRFVAGAMTGANRAAALTHRLLAFSRRQPLDPRPVDANPLVASMEDLLRRTLGERIDLEFQLAPDLWATLCDPNQLESAVLNLAINARDAMPEGGRLLIETLNCRFDTTERLPEGLEPGDYVTVAVTDTGQGMSEAIKARAFEPFFTTKPIGQGTGLGLSMIYGFARQSGGSAVIRSAPEEGTTIRLHLPRFLGDTAEPTSPTEAPEDGRTGAALTVLVVEDEQVVRSLVVEVLEEFGFTVLEAADGPSGLQILQGKDRIDLLITDIGLPGLNGRQLADAGRQLRPELKVLLMTGYAENAVLATQRLEPGLSLITKPFALDALSRRLREILEG